MNTQFSPISFTQIRGVFNHRQLRLATQTQSMGDGTVLATFSDLVLRDNPSLRDVPSKRAENLAPQNVDSRVFELPPITPVSLLGRSVHVMLFDDVQQRNGTPSRRFRGEFRGKVTDENTTFIRLQSELDSGNPHKVSELEWFSKFNNRLMEITINE